MTLPIDVLPEGRLLDVGDGLVLHAHDLGEGPPLVFLHGSGPGASGWSNFHANAAFLVERGYRCVLPDLLGYGRSSKPTDRDYTLAELGTRLLAALDALGIRTFTAIGNSAGGAVAMWLALEHPDRVSRLVLMAPGGLEERETYLEMRGIRSMMRCLYGPEGLTLDGMFKVFEKQVFDVAVLPRDEIERRYEVARTQPRHVFESLRVTNQAGRLGEIRCPTLCLWGVQDQFCPVSGAMRIAEHVVGSRVVLIHGCGHWVMVEHQDLFDRTVLDFLQHG